MTIPIEPTGKKKMRSAVSIAKLLCTEGFTDDLASKLDLYWRRAAGLTDRQRRQLKDLKVEFGEIMRDLNVGDRLVVGKFLGLQKKIGFDTGLRVGLGAFAAKNGQEVDVALPTPDPTRRRRSTPTE